MFFQLSLGIMSSESNFYEFEGGQHTNLILGLLEIFNIANFVDNGNKGKINFLFNEEMQPHHLHMFHRQCPEVTEYLVQNVATSVEPLCY